MVKKEVKSSVRSKKIVKVQNKVKIKSKNQKKKLSDSKGFDMSSIKASIENSLKPSSGFKDSIKEERKGIAHIANVKDKKKVKPEDYIKTGVPGFDDLFENGIPKGNAVIMAGGAGSGKTIMCLQILNYQVSQGKRCLYMSFEESEERLKKHMTDFGWDADKMIKSKKLRIQRYSPFDITRKVDAMLAKEKGELLIDINPVLLPGDFNPEIVILDSLTAIGSAFTGKEDQYRIYIEQLFRFFEKIGSTTFLITETDQVPKIFSSTGVEEFLADGVIVLYAIKKGDIRENAIEVLKMRGEKHQKKIVAMQITDSGVVVYPDQEVFSEI